MKPDEQQWPDAQRWPDVTPEVAVDNVQARVLVAHTDTEQGPVYILSVQRKKTGLSQTAALEPKEAEAVARALVPEMFESPSEGPTLGADEEG